MKPSPELSRVASLRETARLIVDANGQIRDANAAAHRLLGYENGTMIGVSVAWLMPPSRHELLGELSSALHGADQVRLESVLMHDDGAFVPIVLTTQPRLSVRGHELAVTLEPNAEVTVVAPPASQTFPLPVQVQAPATLRPPTLKPPTRTQPPPVPERARARHPAREPLPQGFPPSRIRPNALPKSPAREPLVKEPSASGVRQRAEPRRAAQERLPKASASESVRPCDVAEQLGACMELLRWLEMQLQEGKEQGVRERALSRVMLREAASLVELCHAELSRSAVASTPQD